MYAAVQAIEYYLPAKILSNEDLVASFPEYTPEKIAAKTGIESRHIAAEDEWASDLAAEAGRRLLAAAHVAPEEVDFLLLCTQSPDYLLPSTACLVQDRLGIPTCAGAMDISLGCSGFVFGLSLAKGLIETGQARTLLLLTCETYSKYMDPRDFSTRALFGDGASATLIRAVPEGPEPGGAWLGPFVFGTEGRGYDNLIVRRGGTRHLGDQTDRSRPGNADAAGRDPAALWMNGPEIFTFTLKAVPDSVHALLQSAGIALGDVDLFVFHQANRFILEHLRKKLRIPEPKFVYAMSDCGNTTSSTIPIALRRAWAEGRLRNGDRVLLAGFGVGYSWAATVLRWHPTTPPPL